MSKSALSEYAQFRKTFFEECAEVLGDMEVRVAGLQSSTVVYDDLNAIFRAVHSIKAGAGAFEFTELVQFSHIFEALLDQMRDGHIQPDERICNTLVRASDILSALVAGAQEERPVEKGFGSDIADELRIILDATAGPIGSGDNEVKPNCATAEETILRRYRVSFRPFAELFRHANEPLLLIRELKRLGELITSCNDSRLPQLTALDPEEAYLAWIFELTTTRGESDIAEVFEFVDQDCALIIEELASQPAVSAAPPRLEEAAAAAEDMVPTRGTSAAAENGADRGHRQNAARSMASSIRVDISRVDRLVNMAGELVITQAMLAEQIAAFCRENHQGQTGIQGHEELATLTRELQECVMAIRMQPVRSVFARMPRLAREIAGKLGKSVRFVTSGEHTEVDKTIIEELADPLTHMIRNAVDHGVESPEARRAAGKREQGLIELSASHVGSNILITIQDDGAGINRERLLAKAIEKGVVPPGAALTNDEIEDLIFAPGMSTAEAITDVSGRGVGMDVVRRNITSLGGRITVHSTPGKGTRFTLIIPLTLAVLDGMVVAVGSERYILPLTSIVESFRPAATQIRALAGAGEVASVRGDFFRVVHLDRVFNVPGAIANAWEGLVVLVETAGGERVGIKVDELIDQRQVVIKGLQENFRPVTGISGATILGNGRVALILDIEQLTRMSSERTVSIPIETPDSAPLESPANHSALAMSA